MAKYIAMKDPDKSGGGPIPKWMRLLIEKWRTADQSAAYLHAVPPPPMNPVRDSAPDERAPSKDDPHPSSGED